MVSGFSRRPPETQQYSYFQGSLPQFEAFTPACHPAGSTCLVFKLNTAYIRSIG